MALAGCSGARPPFGDRVRRLLLYCDTVGQWPRHRPRRLNGAVQFGALGWVIGYELPIGTDIFRGRYRDSFEHPTPIPPGQPQHYRFTPPQPNYVFKPGHRITVQIQSILFPLYDRNPQTFVDNPLYPKPTDYKPATITVLRSADQASAIWLPVAP